MTKPEGKNRRIVSHIPTRLAVFASEAAREACEKDPSIDWDLLVQVFGYITSRKPRKCIDELEVARGIIRKDIEAPHDLRSYVSNTLQKAMQDNSCIRYNYGKKKQHGG